MPDRWLVTPQFFEVPEPGLLAAAPDGAAVNRSTGMSGRTAGEMAGLHRPVAAFVAAALAEGDRPVSLAGDCCTAVAALAGVRQVIPEPWFVWIDAHGDFNTPETSPSQFLGGMPLAMAVGRGPQWMCEAVGLTPLDEALVTLVDARDLDPLEAEALAASRVRHLGDIVDLATLRLEGPGFIHVDLDVIDAREAPAFSYPVEGGPSAAEVAEALAAFAAANQIAAISFSGWDANSDTDGRTLASCRQVIAALAET